MMRSLFCHQNVPHQAGWPATAGHGGDVSNRTSCHYQVCAEGMRTEHVMRLVSVRASASFSLFAATNHCACRLFSRSWWSAMANDGMLLNVSIGEEPIAPKIKYVGGGWRDRRSEQKAAQWQAERTKEHGTGHQQGHLSVGNHGQKLEGQREQHRAKRQRIDGEFRPASTTLEPKNGVEKQVVAASAGSQQIISSLFSYNPAPVTKGTPDDAVRNNVPIEPSNAPLASELDTFTSLGVSRTLAFHLLNKMGLKAPTAIQKAAIPQLNGDDSDAFIQAETGSGKTLAYLLPILQKIMELPCDAVHRDSGLFAIILAPTRELSKQIALVLESILRCAHWIVAGTVIGGEKKKSEKARLRKGLNVLVATPGRLADHLEHTKVLDISNVRWLVLDEGDRLMELGFQDDIQKIISHLNLRMRAAKEQGKIIPGLPRKRTTILCSATMKTDVEKLGQISLKEAAHVNVTSEAGRGARRDEKEAMVFTAPAQLKQSYAVVAPKLRLMSLIGYLQRAFGRKGSVMKAIVFISCADSVDFHFDVLTRCIEDADSLPPEVSERTELVLTAKTRQRKHDRTVQQSDPTALAITHAESPLLSPDTHRVTAYRLHGSLPQPIRTSTLAHFTKQKEPALLLATDVASRGLDVPNVDLIVEFDPAFSRDDHLHRIGRTARAGREGRACIFLMPGCEEGYVDVLKNDRRHEETAHHIGRQVADEILKRSFALSGNSKNDVLHKAHRASKTEYMDRATALQLRIERWILASPARQESARRAFQSHVRAYATHVATERGYFDIKQLHLGHLAKAFALRERPGGLKVPGLRTGAGRDSRDAKTRRVGPNAPSAQKPSQATDDAARRSDVQSEAAKMKRAVKDREKFMRGAGGADEFNLG